MAERRMFAKSVVMSDAFLDLPASARCLYYSLGIQADDDGFLNAPNSIIRMCGASPDDLRLLVSKKFLIQFDSGILAVTHWRVHNQIQKDRYRPTRYVQERSRLLLNKQKVYEWLADDCIQSGYKVDTQDRLGKDRLGEDRLDKVSADEREESSLPGFAPPSLAQIRDYCRERNNQVQPEQFYDYYCSNGWRVGKGPMRDWKAALRRWEKNGMDPPAARKQEARQWMTMADENPEEIRQFMGLVL